MDGEVDGAGEQRVAQRRDEDAGAADLRDGGGVDVALGLHAHELDRAAQAGADLVGDVPRLGERERTGAGAEAQRSRVSHAGPRRRPQS